MMRQLAALLRSRLVRLSILLAIPLCALAYYFLSQPRMAETHSSPIIDGMFTGDWCSPAFPGMFGPDTFTMLTPPVCPLGDEWFWDDWDAVTYGAGITDGMGWILGGVPGAAVPLDLETDLNFMATTADMAAVYYALALGMFPSTGGTPPHAQIAIDLDGPASGNPFWYDPPPPGGTGAVALAAGLFPDYLITTDVVAGVAYVWEATSAPGAWTLVGPTPLAWSGALGPGPGVIEILVPWPMFAAGPPFGIGVPAFMTVMTAHSRPFAGPSDAPMTPEDDVFTETGAGVTTSPDFCPPGIGSTDCELFLGPGGGAFSADAFIALAYAPPAATATPTDTPSATATDTPSASPTATATDTPGPSPTPTDTVTPGPSPTATATNTPNPATPTATATATRTPSPTPTATATPQKNMLPIMVRQP